VSDLGRYEAIDLTLEGSILTASFNRPEQMNAINSAVHRELETLFVDADADDEVELVVLTGRGRAFSAGGDLDWLLELNADPAASARAIAGDRRIQNALLNMETPIIAKVNGPAVGLGCSIALFCDVVIAVPDAVFSDPHVSVGLVAGDGGALLWPQLPWFRPRASIPADR
jgi:enoyl-CoA hydratase